MQIDDKSIMFRGNSIATKSIESYMKLIGDTYLKQTLSDIVRSIIETNVELEIDPSKVSNQSNLQMNREELIQILYLVCGKVFNSCTYFPHELRQVFCLLRKMCIDCGKTDEMCDMIISASIFLRFICPAILSPNLFNLTQEYPHEKAARKLTLAAKTLQTIANFSKFGGKEFYMSFDKMNRFVDEHTILMREFLRTISSESEFRSNIDDRDANNKTKTQFDCEYLIDLGKQLSILHSLLSSIMDTLDKTNVEKLGNLKEILNEIKELKSTNIGTSTTTTTTTTVNGISSEDNGIDIKINQKLLVINNLYHQAIQNTTTGIINTCSNNNEIKSTAQSEINHQQETTQAAFHENALDSDNIAAVALNQVNSVTNLIEQNLIINAKETEIATSSSAESSTVDIYNQINNNSNNNINNSDSQQTISPSYSSEATINFINVKVNKPLQLSSSTTDSTTLNKNTNNEEMSDIMKRLYETERELKREQQEKALIEYKYKQQEQEHNQQMKTLINRLIKVEEELHNEKLELHKLLKAKQEIIDLQKKRIEGLTNRLAYTQQQQQHHYYHYHTTNTNNNNVNPKQQQHSSTNGKHQNPVITKPYQSIQLTQSVNNNPVELVDQYTTSLNEKKNNFSSSSSSSSSSSNTYLRTSEL